VNCLADIELVGAVFAEVDALFGATPESWWRSSPTQANSEPADALLGCGGDGLAINI
jgi:hypothetical protein